jgi:hypothetical protein
MPVEEHEAKLTALRSQIEREVGERLQSEVDKRLAAGTHYRVAGETARADRCTAAASAIESASHAALTAIHEEGSE